MNITPIVKLDRVIDVRRHSQVVGQAIRFSLVWFNDDWGVPMYVQDGWRLMPGWKIAPPSTFGVSGLMMSFNRLDPRFADQLKEVLASYESVIGPMGPWMPGSAEQGEKVLDEDMKGVK